MAPQLPEGSSKDFNTDTLSELSTELQKPVITKQPRRVNEPDLQHTFAKEWESKDAGFYGNLVDKVGYISGQLGMVPCCCCANPFKRVNQGYVGLVSKFGQLQRIVDPGLVRINQFSEKLISANVMLKTMQIPVLSSYTKDNVSIQTSSVVYYQIIHPEVAYYSVDNVDESLRERTQTTLRQVIGSRNLQDVIERREEIAASIEEIISEPAASWGVRIESLLIKELVLPTGVANSLSMAAEAKRIGESKIIQARAEVESAKLMRKAADILASKPAMQIRYLDAMQNMAKSSNSKVIFMPSQSSVEQQAMSASGGGVVADDSYNQDLEIANKILSFQEIDKK